MSALTRSADPSAPAAHSESAAGSPFLPVSAYTYHSSPRCRFILAYSVADVIELLHSCIIGSRVMHIIHLLLDILLHFKITLSVVIQLQILFLRLFGVLLVHRS